jgi:hypothetical protein
MRAGDHRQVLQSGRLRSAAIPIIGITLILAEAISVSGRAG